MKGILILATVIGILLQSVSVTPSIDVTLTKHVHGKSLREHIHVDNNGEIQKFAPITEENKNMKQVEDKHTVVHAKKHGEITHTDEQNEDQEVSKYVNDGKDGKDGNGGGGSPPSDDSSSKDTGLLDVLPHSAPEKHTSDNKNATQANTQYTVSYVLGAVDEAEIGPAAVACAMIAIGIIVTFAGYRLFRPCTFVFGFIFGGCFLAMTVEKAFAGHEWIVAGSWIAFFVGGCATGALVYWLLKVGIFIIGAAAGLFCAIVINNSVGYKINPEKPELVLYCLAFVLGICGGILALKLTRPVVIFATSLVGAQWVILGAAHFIGHYPSAADLEEFRKKNSNGDWAYEIPDEWWVYLAATVILFLCGLTVQFTKTSERKNWHE